MTIKTLITFFCWWNKNLILKFLLILIYSIFHKKFISTQTEYSWNFISGEIHDFLNFYKFFKISKLKEFKIFDFSPVITFLQNYQNSLNTSKYFGKYHNVERIQVSTCINRYVTSEFDTKTTTIDIGRYGDVGQYMMQWLPKTDWVN